MSRVTNLGVVVTIYLLLNSIAWAGSKEKFGEDEFFMLFLSFKNSSSVIDRLGQPEARITFDDVTFWYYRIQITSANGKVLNPKIHIVNDRAQTVEYISPEEMDEKILIANARKETLPQVGKEQTTYTVIQFESLVKHRTPEEVLQILGQPDSKGKHESKDVWKYRQVVKSEGKLLNQNLLFDFGRVNYIWSD